MLINTIIPTNALVSKTKHDSEKKKLKKKTWRCWLKDN